MQSILVVFVGLTFPYHVLEYALREAKDKNTAVHLLFLTAANETAEGYGFPSDLNQAETTTDANDALSDNAKIINEHQRLAENMSRHEGIACTTQVGVGCSLEDVVAITANYLLTCVDAGFDNAALFLPKKERFALDELVLQSGSPVKVLSEI